MSYNKPLATVLFPTRTEFLEPFEDLFNDFANSFFSEQSPVQSLHTKRAYPKVDILRVDGDLVIEAAVPGMKKEDLSISIDEGVLTIRGERSLVLAEPVAPEDRDSSFCKMSEITIYVKELKRSSFIRRFTLPPELSINKNDITKAKLEDGILEIRFVGVYDRTPEEPKQIEITID